MNYKNFTYKKTNEGIVITGYNGDDRDLVIPAKIEGVRVVHIGDGAFKNNNLKTVRIPDSVEHIGRRAFFNNNIETVEIPDSVEHIGRRTFEHNNLKTVHIPDSVEQIGDWAFAYNDLESVEIPSSVEHIGDWTFYNNDLKTVKIPSSVEHIGGWAFKSNDLKTVKIPSSVEHIGGWTFAYNNLETVKIPDSVEHIGDVAFDRNDNITKITWGDTSYDVRCIDGYCMIIDSEKKKRGDYQIMRCRFFGGDFEESYVAEKDGYTAHGDNAKEAIEDCNFKIMSETRDKSEIVAEVKDKGTINPVEYHLLTGACKKMIRRFCKQNGIDIDEEVPVDKAVKLTKGEYGHEELEKLVTK